MAERRSRLPATASEGEVDAFLATVASTPLARRGTAGRLMFAMDATASREPSWDRACSLQAEMFDAAGDEGGLQVQLVYFRGFHEFHTSPWLSDTRDLSLIMTRVRCAGGLTQIDRVLRHALLETASTPVDALVYVGDCMEESVDTLCQRAGELGLQGVPAFVFQEGNDDIAEKAFRQLARLTRGAYCHFDAGSAEQLRELLRAVAVFAAGGRKALQRLARGDHGLVRKLAHQLS